MEMMDLVKAFPEQLRKAHEIAENSNLNKSNSPLKQVFISGLGGSGIGGTIVSEIVFDKAHMPILVGKDYFAPAWVNENTLAIICTYSGNTEETLQVFKECIKRRAKITVISSGGEAIQIAKENGIDHIVVPAGFPPRSCIGYSIGQILKTLSFHDVISENLVSEFPAISKFLETESNDIREKAQALSKGIKGKLPVIYTLGNTEGVAIRFRQQLNENSKVLCWHHVIPEMNHNELVAWTENHPELCLLILRYESDYYRSLKRLEVCEKIIASFTPLQFELHAKGSSVTERALYMIHLVDYISCELAELKGADAMDISVIDKLKGELAALK